MRRIVVLLPLCAALLYLVGCGFTPVKQQTTTTKTSATITVSAQGGASTVREGSSQQFTASISDNSTSAFTWAVNGTPGGNATLGTIDATGKYTAPAVGVALANPTNVSITASANGVTSSGASLSLQYPVPSVASTDVTQLAVGIGSTVTVTGANFVNGAQIVVGSAPVTTTFVDSSHLTATITASAAGTVNISVMNPNPGSANSTQLALAAVVTPTISGVAAKNFLGGAVITAYPVDPTNDTEGSPIGTATTAADGSFTLHLTEVPAGPVRLKATGGSFVNDTDVSNTVQNTIELDTLLDSVTSDVSGIAITVLTDMVNSITDGLFSGAASSPNLVKHAGAGGFLHNLTSSHGQGKVIVKGLYKLIKDPENTPPSNDGSDPDGLKVTIISGSMYQCGINSAKASGATAGDWIKALSLDFSDGLFDGMYKDAQGVQHQVMLKTSSGQVPLSSSAGTTDFLNCMNQFTQGTNTVINNPNNQVNQNTITQTTGTIAAGVVTSPVSPSTGLNSGASGSVASMTINGRQYLFVAARNSGLVVIDITDPTAPSPPIKVWTNLAAYVITGNTGGYSNLGLVVPVLGNATHNQLLVFSYSYGHIGILNADKLVSGTPGVDDADATAIAASGLVDFSGDATNANGGSTYGALLDVARKGVWIYIYGGSKPGYEFFDLTTNTVTSLYPQDSGYYETENLGGDTAANWIFGANYSGVQLIDLAGGISYDIDPAFYTSNSFEFDQSAVDTNYHVALGMSECYNYVGVFDLSKVTLTAPASQGMPGSWVPAQGGFVKATLNSAGYYNCVETVGVESSTHTAIMSEEWGSDQVYVVQIDNPAAPASGAWAGFSDWTYSRTSTSSVYSGGFYDGAGDPHSIGTALAVANGKPYGYILSSDNKHLLVVDMQGMLAAQRTGASGDAAHTINGDPATAGLWWVLNW